MKIIEKIINAFLVVQHKKIQVKNITFLDNGQGMFSGMSFDADVSLEFMYESAKAYSSCFCDIPFPGFEDANLEEITKFQLDALKQRKNHSFIVNHLRFPIVLREGCKIERGEVYSISNCTYNKERLQYLFSQDIYGKLYNSLEKELSSFFSFINVEVHELLKDAVCFALKILNKISLDTPERLIKAFNYRDWYCSYDVELFRKGLPGHILEELIAPDILLSDLNGCRKILRNAKRFLNGHTKTNCVYIKYEWWLGPVDTSHSAKLMSDKEINNRSDLKNFSKVFFKECVSSGKSEYENHLSEKEHALRYNY
ncbi:hypothetical protein [Enterobacter hormaechei]|uniref:hypothetical protein n=1 Tax=Enterobacter hormaechei TaxID=158836 RepID=UPI000798ADD9|nr:hypothetical protein [Enterobacter hormaechei]CZY85505.1 Uncharacterised protein [Enterobacter hormaechei]